MGLSHTSKYGNESSGENQNKQKQKQLRFLYEITFIKTDKIDDQDVLMGGALRNFFLFYMWRTRLSQSFPRSWPVPGFPMHWILPRDLAGKIRYLGHIVSTARRRRYHFFHFGHCCWSKSVFCRVACFKKCSSLFFIMSIMRWMWQFFLHIQNQHFSILHYLSWFDLK